MLKYLWVLYFMLNKKFKYVKWFVFCIFIIITIFVLSNFNGLKIDIYFYKCLSKYVSNDLTIIVRFFTYFGSWFTLIPLAILILIFVKNNRIKWSISLNLLFSFLVNFTLKNIIRRPRPDFVHLVTEKGFSFPSSHAMVSTAFYGYIIYLIYKNVNNKLLKYILIGLLSLLIIIICVSRVYLGIHYLSDVIGGFVFAICYLIIYIDIIKTINF